MSPQLRQPATAAAGASAPATVRPAPVSAAETGEHWIIWLRLAAFVALAAYAAGHWSLLVEGASIGRTLLVVLVATGGALALIPLGQPPVRGKLSARLGDRPRAAGAALAAAALVIGVATIALGLGAAGLPLRLLGPENWSELADGLDRGLSGVQSVDWPYDGPDEWIRLTILLGAPLLLGLAALVAFFPARRGRTLLHSIGLVLLLVAYGTAVTEHDPGEPLLRGLVLLLLVGAWLWLPRMGRRDALVGAAAVVLMGLLSLPAAAALDAERAWWNYRAWDWFGSGKAITFDWTHEYGPLDWPREGTTLLNVRSDRPHYWKAETLDAFDGLRWFRSPQPDRSDVGSELPIPFEPRGPSWELFEMNPRWDEEIDVTVRSLTTDLVVGAGTIYRVDGTPHSISGDGTARVQGEPLEKGDTYTVATYAPNPTQRQMRQSSTGAYGYPGDFIQYTRVYLPDRGDDAREGTGRAGDAARTAALGLEQPLDVPLRGETLSGESDADQILRRSRYGDMYRLALEWTQGADTNYDLVKAVERNLQEEYIYSERVPTRPIPLNGFLFEDRRGYCQQFSGTMALMLRMLGVPTRVAAGFSPGSYNRDTGEYRDSRPRRALVGRGLLHRYRVGAVRPDAHRRAGREPVRRGGRERGQRRRRRGRQPARRRGRGARDAGRRDRHRRRRHAGLGDPGPRPAGADGRGRNGLVRRAPGPCPARPLTRAARLRPARRAAPGPRSPRLEGAGGHHAARPRAPAAAQRGPSLRRLRAPAARAPLRPAQPRGARSRRAPGPAARAHGPGRPARAPARPLRHSSGRPASALDRAFLRGSKVAPLERDS